jgi:peptidoglycan/LPS O-acetylase OafA/YrhL
MIRAEPPEIWEGASSMTELQNQTGYRPAGRPSRLPSLTGMRMVAALLVFLFHSTFQGFFASQNFVGKYTSLVYQGSWAALTFFFCLSGFVLTWSARPSDTTWSYYRRRILKIYPTTIITAAVGALLMFTWVHKNLETGGGTPSPITVVSNFLLTQSWSPDYTVRTALDPPSWSLSCELLFYLLFPLFFALIKRIRPERLWAWFAGVAAVAVVIVPVLVSTVVPHSNPMPGFGFSLQQFWLLVQFPPTRALEFVLGMLLARIVMTGQRLPISLGAATAWTVLTYAICPLFHGVVSNNAIMLVPICLLVATLAVADAEKRHTFWSTKVMVKLGEISFAFYMVHYLVLMYVGHLLGSRALNNDIPAGIGIVLLMLAIALVLSYLLFTYVENPIMRKWSQPRRKLVALKPVVAGPQAVPDGPDEIKRAS